MFYQLQLIKAIWISTNISMTKWPKAHRTRSPLALSTLCLRWKGQLWGFCRCFTRWHKRNHRIKLAFHTTWDTDLLWFLCQRSQLSPAFPSRDPHDFPCWRPSLWWLGLVPFPPCSKDWDSSAASAPATVRLEGEKYWKNPMMKGYGDTPSTVVSTSDMGKTSDLWLGYGGFSKKNVSRKHVVDFVKWTAPK